MAKKRGRRRNKKRKRTAQRVKIKNPTYKNVLRSSFVKKSAKRPLKKKILKVRKPKMYIKRNFLGLPVAVKINNPTKIQSKIQKIKYQANVFSLKRWIVCARRHIKRQILFAKNKAGSGKKIRTRKHFNEDSKVRC